MPRLHRRVMIAALAGLLPTAAFAQTDVASRADAVAAADTLATLSAGGGTTCLTTTRGDGWCWGSLGFGARRAFRMRGADGQPARVSQLEPWGWSVCGLTTAQQVVCGLGLSGTQLDSAGRRALPAPCRNWSCLFPLAAGDSVASARSVTTGMMHACAVANGAAAWCWGMNHMGQLGNGTRTLTTTPDADSPRAPTRVLGGHGFAKLDAGESLTCGVTWLEKAIYCWGYGQSGQTGDSTVMTYCSGALPDPNAPCSAPRPARVLPESLSGEPRAPSNARFSAVSVGMRLACAIDDRDAAYCWGGNYRCALGRCRLSDQHRAHRIQIAGRVAEIGAGYWHACARTRDGRIFCWGDNVVGQLGSLASVNLEADGIPPDYRNERDSRAQGAAYSDDPCFNGGRCSPVPVEVSAGRRWAALAVGSDHACALARDDGRVYCWGGRDTTAFASDQAPQWCVNRSAVWKDERCYHTPVAVAGLPVLAAAARASTETPTLPARPQVEVSRREVRVAFPIDTTAYWGWPPAPSASSTHGYWWQLSVSGMDGPKWIWFTVIRDSTAREHTSFAELVRTGRAQLCRGGMVLDCNDAGLSAIKRRDSLVITLRDTTEIGRLFALRPAFLQYSVQRPGDGHDAGRDSVRVDYVQPRIPPPTADTRAEFARAVRRYEASINSYHRSISSETEWSSGWGHLWLEVGDSIPVRVAEMHCTYDTCSGTYPPPVDSSWSVSDSRVARLQPRDTTTRSGTYVSSRRARYMLHGLRPGRAVLRVRGIRSSADTAPSSRRPGRELEREVIVTPRVVSVRFFTKPDTVRAGAPFTLDVRAFDADGGEVADVPIELRFKNGGIDHVGLVGRRTPHQLYSPGVTRLVARVKQLADTATIVAVDSAASRR